MTIPACPRLTNGGLPTHAAPTRLEGLRSLRRVAPRRAIRGNTATKDSNTARFSSYR